MTIAWMIYVLLVGALLAVGAWCIEDALRASRLPTRWVWAAALLSTIAFAGYAIGGAATQAPVPLMKVTTTAAASASPTPSQTLFGDFEQLRSTAASAVALGIASVTKRIPGDVVRGALALWAAASTFLLLAHLVVNRRVIRQRRGWPIASLPGGTARVAPALGPAVVGLASPEIVVPQWLLEKTDDEQRLVMVHEQEHIASRDQYLPFGALLVATLLPWHPAVWWSLARLRLAVELDCDARVLRRGVHAQPYGTLLIDIAAQCGGHRMGAVALADRTSHLERRILAMTQHTRRFAAARTIALVGVAALAIVTACEARLPTSSEVQAMDVAAAEKGLAEYKVIDDRTAGNVVYVVNGETVTAEKAHGIPANLIATMNVVKGERNPEGKYGPSIVRIVTTNALSAPSSDNERLHMKIAAEAGATPPTPKGMVLRKDKFDGLLYVDGVLAPEGALAKLKPDDIASINILKGEAARAMSSSPAAANGIIKVVTKAAAKAGTKTAQ